jgi:hypothetical protein
VVERLPLCPNATVARDDHWGRIKDILPGRERHGAVRRRTIAISSKPLFSGFEPVIPSKSHRKAPGLFRSPYFWAIATRYATLAKNFLAGVQLRPGKSRQLTTSPRE